MNRTLYSVIIFFFAISLLHSQEKHRFQDDVSVIKKYDQIYAVPHNPIVFVGSSSIRKWDNVERTFGQYDVMNRGVGGAVINDIIYYLDDLVTGYKPRQIVIYVGENDLGDQASTADSIFHRTQRLVTAVRTRMPQTPIIYISIKPSPVREKVIQKAIDSNRLIKPYIESLSNARYIDVFNQMITPEGKSRPELFLDDMLHLNPKGYAIWIKAIKPYLLKK